MKRLIVTISLVFVSACALAQTFVTPGIVSNANIGSSASSRTDAQAEFRNDGGVGHGMITIKQMVNPGVADREAALNFSAFDSAGLDRQLGSVSYQWSNNAILGSGFAVLRFEVNTIAGSGEVPLRLWGGQQGAVFFGSNGLTGDHDPAGGPLVRINRTNGYPSLAGNGDLVLEAKFQGIGPLYLNTYGGGSVVVGGELTLSDSTSWGCPTSVPAGVDHCKRFVDKDGQYSYWPVYR